MTAILGIVTGIFLTVGFSCWETIKEWLGSFRGGK